MSEDTKQAYKNKMQARIQEWESEIERLRTKANSVSADAKVELEKRIADLQKAKEEIKGKIAQINDAAEGAWEAVKEELDKAGKSLHQVFEDTRNG